MPEALRLGGLPARRWVDLFYDLAVAAGIIALSGAYAYDHSPVGTLWFALAYALLWCTWLLTSSATGSFTAEGATHTVWSVSLLVAQMGAMLLLAIAATDSVDASAEVFDILLGVALLIVAILAVRARRHGLGGARRIPVLAGLATLTLVGSWFLDARLSLLVWCLALALVAWAAWAVTSDPRIDQHRLRHRLGELTIIVLGEILVKMVLTVGEETLWSVSLVALVPSFGILSAIWWAYFVTGDRSRSSSRGLPAGAGWPPTSRCTWASSVWRWDWPCSSSGRIPSPRPMERQRCSPVPLPSSWARSHSSRMPAPSPRSGCCGSGQPRRQRWLWSGCSPG